MNKIEKLFEDKIEKIFKERLKNQLISNIKINKIDSFIGYRSANGFEEVNEPKKPISCAELLFKISFKWKGFLDNYLKKSIIQSTFNSITLETSARTKVKNIIFDNEISFELLITKKLDKIILKDGEIKNEVDIWQ